MTGAGGGKSGSRCRCRDEGGENAAATCQRAGDGEEAAGGYAGTADHRQQGWVDPSAIGNQLYFSATDSNSLSVIISIGKNGMISWCTFYYNDSVLVSESEEKYFEQLTDNYISSYYTDIHKS